MRGEISIENHVLGIIVFIFPEGNERKKGNKRYYHLLKKSKVACIEFEEVSILLRSYPG